MSRRSQDIPIRPRYGYADEGDGEESGMTGQNRAQSRSNCGATPASYSEIPFLAQYAGPVPEHVLQDITPTAGKPPTLGSESYVNLDSGEEENDDEDNDDDDEEEEEEQSNSNSKDSSGEATHKANSRPKSLQSCR